MVAVAQEGVAVVAVDGRPERGVDLVAMAGLDAQAGLGDGAALALELLALLRGEAVEEVGEVAVAAVQPVELHAAAQEQAGVLQQLTFRLAHEQALPGLEAPSSRVSAKRGLDQGGLRAFAASASRRAGAARARACTARR
jgi:hypothetical protein